MRCVNSIDVNSSIACLGPVKRAVPPDFLVFQALMKQRFVHRYTHGTQRMVRPRLRSHLFYTLASVIATFASVWYDKTAVEGD
jgi:hypothetical protein